MTRLLVLPFVVVLLDVMLRVLQHGDFLNHDVAMYAQCAQLILSGKVPYVDFVDINFPANFYVFLLPVWLDTWMHLSLTVMVNEFVWLLLVASLILCYCVIRQKVEIADVPLLTAVLFGFTVLNLPLFFHFGQREHLFVLAFMPFFLTRWLRYEGKQIGLILPVITGATAGLGASLKPPYFLVFLILIELFWLVRTKRLCLLTPEIISCAITLLLLLLSFLSFTLPADAFLHRWIPLTLEGSGAFACPLKNLFLFAVPWSPAGVTIFMVAGICACAFFTRKKHSLVGPLLAWTGAGYLIYLLQQKGWDYHSIVMTAGYFMLANLILMLAVQKLIAARMFVWLNTWAKPPVLQLILYLTGVFAFSPLLVRDSFSMEATDLRLNNLFAAYAKKGDRIFVVSGHVYPQYPCLAQMSLLPASRYIFTYPINMYHWLIIKERAPLQKTAYGAAQHYVVQEICKDIKTNQPKIIAVAGEDLQEWADLYQGGFKYLLNDYRPLGIWNGNQVWLQCR